MFQVFQSGNPRADEIVLSNMAMAFDRMFFDVEVFFNYLLYHYVCIASNVCPSTIYQYWIQVISFYESLVWNIIVLFQDPFVFPPYHKALREPFDYYMFGQNYIRPLVDFRWGDNFYVLPSLSGFVDKSWFGFNQLPEIEDLTCFMSFHMFICIIHHSSILICMHSLDIYCFMKSMWSLSVIT